MIEFIKEVEAAEKGSLGLSEAVLERLGYTFSVSGDLWFKEGFSYIDGRTSSVTHSIDNALQLLPPNYHWLIHDGSDIPNHPGGFASLHKKGETGEYAHIYGRAATPALALCSAILRVAGEVARNGEETIMELSKEMKSALSLCALEIIAAGKDYDRNTREMLEKALTKLVEKILKETTINEASSYPSCGVCMYEIKKEIVSSCSRIACPHKAFFND